jgi:glycosyltransferase involved in cell wall biosynthesis
MGAADDRTTVAFTYGFPFTAGGVEAHVLSLVSHGDRSRFRWLLVGDAGEEFRRSASSLDVPIVPWRAPSWPGDIGAVRRLLKILERNRVGLIHAHGPRGLVQAAVAGRLAGIPVVSTVHLPTRFLIRGRGAAARLKICVYRLLDRILVRRLVARTIFVSSSVCRESLAGGLVVEKRARVIPNGVELARFRGPSHRDEVRRTLGIPKAAVVACFVGRLEAQKGVDALVEALATLPVEELCLYLLVVGDGSMKGDLEALVRTQALAEHVRFLSFRSDVESILGASDLFVLPSRFEAMPIALVEAMAAGLPSVVTDVGDNAAVVERGALGLVVAPGDVKALAGAMGALARDTDKRTTMGARAHEAAAGYSAEAATRAVEQVYAEVLLRTAAKSGKLS